MESEIGVDEPVTSAVVRAVSAVVGQNPRSLQPLGRVLDTDALDDLFGHRSNGDTRTGGRLSFVYAGCNVTVYNGEYLTINPLDGRF